MQPPRTWVLSAQSPQRQAQQKIAIIQSGIGILNPPFLWTRQQERAPAKISIWLILLNVNYF